MVRLTAHWATLGKQPASLDDYEVIDCSAGAITRRDFRMWLKAFTSGTMEPSALPRVATSYFTTGEFWLGLSLQKEPDSQDGFHRPYAMTYYICVRWADAAARVSYRALHDALVKEHFAGDAPFELSLPAYDAHRLADAVNATARRAAGLLLTGRPVCVVQTAQLSVEQRLDFLDAVAALLPYGFRHMLAVSTWTNSATQHRIRLSFAEVAPTHGAWALPWEGCPPAGLPRQALLYEQELNRYQGDDLRELMAWLATLTEPRDFDDESHCAAAIDLLRGRDATKPHPVVARPEPSVEQLLHQCRESIAQSDEPRLRALIPRLLQRAGDQVTEHDRKTYRVLVRENPIRPPAQLDGSVHVRNFFEYLLRLLYPSPMRAADVEEMLVDLGGPDRHKTQLAHPLRAALARILSSGGDLSGQLLIASLLGAEALDPILDGLSADELLLVAVRARNRKVLDIVLAEAKVRAQVADPRVMESITRALPRHRYLIEAIDSSCSAEESVGYYQQVLVLGHRGQLTSADIKAIFREIGHPPPPFQLAIVAESGRGTDAALLRALANGMLRDLNLTGRPIADRVRAGLDRVTADTDDDGSGRRTYQLGSQTLVPTLGKVLIGGVIVVVLVALLAVRVWL
ncbi:hypothetical protein [Nonomuraea glycinis]|uniref:hypothetical protein n=1 Tax=Nonomuraea glycinis TaxID=2047744 RepID=UPI0033A7C62D